MDEAERLVACPSMYTGADWFAVHCLPSPASVGWRTYYEAKPLRIQQVTGMLDHSPYQEVARYVRIDIIPTDATFHGSEKGKGWPPPCFFIVS